MANSPELPLPETWKPFSTREREQPPAAASKSLVSKLAEVMATVERIAKRGHNDHFNYDFATESDITAAIRVEMARRQLMLVPDMQALTYRDAQTKSGITTICCVHIKFTVMDGESGESISFTIPGEGQDSGDKGVPKALTSALKYALLKLFMLPTGDDSEDTRTAEAKKASRKGATVSARPELDTPLPPANGSMGAVISRAPVGSRPIQIPEGCVWLLEVQPGTWGKARGQITLVDANGDEGKFAMFNQADVVLAQVLCENGDLVRADFATPQKGGKTYLKRLSPLSEDPF